MKKAMIGIVAGLLVLGASAQANLLLNGDFNAPGDGSPATDWTAWSWGNGWANTEISSPLPGNDGWGSAPPDTWHLAVGAAGGGGGGYYQFVPATAGIEYELSVSSGADDWWLPTGTMDMFFLDGTGSNLLQATRNTVDPAVYGDNYDIPHPWESYSLTAIAPAGTVEIKVEFAANNATGSVGFDQAVLIPEPASLALFGAGILALAFRRKQH